MKLPKWTPQDADTTGDYRSDMTHEKYLASQIVEMFDEWLESEGLRVHDPERDMNGAESSNLWGTKYDNLVSEVESLISIRLTRITPNESSVPIFDDDDIGTMVALSGMACENLHEEVYDETYSGWSNEHIDQLREKMRKWEEGESAENQELQDVSKDKLISAIKEIAPDINVSSYVEQNRDELLEMIKRKNNP